jgi:hypothetical protein
VAGLCLLAAFAVAQTGPGRSLLRTAGIDGGPAHYTALSFGAPAHLPASATGAPDVAVVVTNREGANRTYGYELSQDPAGTARSVIATGSVAVAAGQTARLNLALPVDCTGLGGERVRLTLRLVQRTEAVGFWTTCPAPAPKPDRVQTNNKKKDAPRKKNRPAKERRRHA